MARFRGTVEGGRGEASRLGHRASGLRVTAGSWRGVISVMLHARDGDDDWATVLLSPVGKVEVITLYNGPLHEYRDPRGKRIAIITDKEIEHE